MIAVQTRELSRVYKARGNAAEVLALDAVSMEIEQGEVRGLLGPNGAGKTTLVKILSTVLLPSSGSAEILGHDVARETAAVRPLIGIVFGGDRGLYGHLTGRQNLEYWAALYNVPARETASRISALLERVGLLDRANYAVHTYSRGMKQRLHLGRGLVANARVLFLDEPTTGMDPLAARDFRQLVKDLRAEGRTILLTTHDMAEAEAVCDRVALIDHGRLLAVQTPRTLSEIIAKYERIDFEPVCEGSSASEGLLASDGLLDALRYVPGVASVAALQTPSAGAGAYRVELSDAAAAQQVLATLVQAGVTSIRTTRPSLEEVYMHLIGDRGLKV